MINKCKKTLSKTCSKNHIGISTETPFYAHIMIGIFIQTSTKITIQLQLYTIAKKKRYEMPKRE